jgi:hypothetical protein
MPGRQLRKSIPRWSVGVAIWLLGIVACGQPPPLADTYPDADSLAGAVLDALARKDRTALEAMALSEQEFRNHVWPELPAAKPERNLPFSYVWGDLRQKSTGALGETLARHGGRRYELVRVDFNGQTDYPSYRVHREATLHVRDAAGKEQALRVCGSFIEKDEAWKVFSFVVDE